MAKSSRTRQGTDKPRPVHRIGSSVPHFLQLPIEIFDMIIDYYYPEIPESVIIENHIGVNPKYGERGKVLRALSRTSQALQNQCLSRAWEHIEACLLYPEDTHGVWYKQVSKRLKNVSNGLTECPHLAPYVHVATVTLTRCSANTVLPAFTQCLGILPNLHSLRIIHAHSQMTTALKTWFEGKQYPQIRTIILPSCAHNVLRACPEVTCVYCNEDDGSKLVSAIHSACTKVECLQGIHANGSTMKRLIKAAPQLQELYIRTDGMCTRGKIPQITPDDIKILQKLKHLSILTISVRSREDAHNEKDDELIRTARSVIQNNTSQGETTFLAKYGYNPRPGLSFVSEVVEYIPS